jgi:POT family proton-dependent oligopeptide transporter
MWEKFSFFGMRALQVYYMTKQLHMEQGKASLIFGAYAAGVYLTPIFGAIVSDRWLGKQRGIVLGGLTMAVGHFLMAFEPMFYLAMVTIAVGNGLFLPNLPSQVGDLYRHGDPKRESAFSLYYLGINVGGFLAPLVCGTIGEVYGWHYGFATAGVGMCLGLAIYLGGRRFLPPPQEAGPQTAQAGTAAPAPGATPIALLAAVAAAVVVFRSAYEQTGNTLALWIDESVNRAAGGFMIPATWFQSLNPMLVFLLTPVIVSWWNRGPRSQAPRATALRKMALGAAGVAVSYLLLSALTTRAGPVHWVWVVAFFVLFTTAELYILPVGLSLFAQLAPAGFGATTIAAWFLASFAGNLLSGVVGTWWSGSSPAGFFLAMFGVAGVSGAALFLLSLQQFSAARRRLGSGAPAEVSLPR